MKHQDNNIIIGIDTSCYTTSIAAISLGKKVLFNKKIMLKVKDNTKGLRQSEAVFQHVNNLGEIDEDIKEIIKEYNICAICVSKTPRPNKDSYMPVFTVGYNFAKLSSSLINCNLYETTHQENHIEASLFNKNIKNKNKFLSVHMSGGTTEILLTSKSKDGYKVDIVGGSKDISFGQLIDRIGVRLGYKFPAGKYIDEDALNCEKLIKQGLKTSVKEGYMNLSGIENQVYKIIENEDKDYIAKLLLDSIIRNLYKSLVYISKNYDVDEIVFAGGVSASKYISKEISLKLKKHNIISHFTKAEYSTDNALGCAVIGLNRYLGE